MFELKFAPVVHLIMRIHCTKQQKFKFILSGVFCHIGKNTRLRCTKHRSHIFSHKNSENCLFELKFAPVVHLSIGVHCTKRQKFKFILSGVFCHIGKNTRFRNIYVAPNTTRTFSAIKTQRIVWVEICTSCTSQYRGSLYQTAKNKIRFLLMVPFGVKLESRCVMRVHFLSECVVELK